MEKTWWMLYFVALLSPIVIVSLNRTSLSKPVNPTSINGLITASGILLGLLTAALVNKSDLLEFDIRKAIYLDFIVFGFVVVSMFTSILNYDSPTITDLVVIMMSLLVEIVTAIVIIRRLGLRSTNNLHVDRLQE